MITNSIIAYGDRLGAQMSTLANLIYIAEENKQQIVFYDEIKGFRRHLQFFDVFDMGDYVKLIQRYENIIPSIYSLQFKKKNGGGGAALSVYINLSCLDILMQFTCVLFACVIVTFIV